MSNKRSTRTRIAFIIAALFVFLSATASSCNGGRGVDGRGNDNIICPFVKPGEAPLFQCK